MTRAWTIVRHAVVVIERLILAMLRSWQYAIWHTRLTFLAIDIAESNKTPISRTFGVGVTMQPHTSTTTSTVACARVLTAAITIASVLSLLSIKLLSNNHALTSVMQRDKRFAAATAWAGWSRGNSTYSCESSAYESRWLSKTLLGSMQYMENRSGPSTLPCGTPHGNWTQRERVSRMLTTCDRWESRLHPFVRVATYAKHVQSI